MTHFSRWQIGIISTASILFLWLNTSHYLFDTLPPFEVQLAFGIGLFQLMLIGITFYHSKSNAHGIEPLFWLINGTAFLTGFILALAFIDQTMSERPLLPNVFIQFCYFLFYTLLIGAIEIKQYRRARELLTTSSIIRSSTTLLFTFGLFIYFALANYQSTNIEQDSQQSAQLFHIIMLSYLAVQWFEQAWHQRSIAPTFAGLAFLCWALSFYSMEQPALQWMINGQSTLLISTGFFLFIISLLLLPALNDSDSYNRSTSRQRKLSINAFSLISIIIIWQIALVMSHEPALVLPDLKSLSLLLILSVALLLLYLQTRYDRKAATLKLLEVEKLTLDNHQLSSELTHQHQSVKEKSAIQDAILENTHNPILTVDHFGNILTCNSATIRLFGYSEEQLIGQGFSMLIKPEEELAHIFNFQSFKQTLIRSPQGLERESIGLTKSKEEIYIHVSFSEYQSELQQMVIISITNISQQKQVEQEVLRLKDEFIANISHEFRTPLTIINGVIDNQLTNTQKEQDKSQLQSAKRNSLRMIRMVEQLLELSRIRDQVLTFSNFNARSLLTQICEAFVVVAQKSKIEYEYRINMDVWLKANPSAIEKILFNLLSNAFKYTPQDGQVSVSLSQQGNNYCLTIQDSGIGLSKEQQDKIFNRFHRIDRQETRHIQGVGIGLSLVDELISIHKWKMDLQSELNVGTCFSIFMPQSMSTTNDWSGEKLTDSTLFDVNIATELSEVDLHNQRQQRSDSRHSVLVIEDNFDMQAHLQSILAEQHHCLLASNGEEGIEMAINYVPDIILCDVMMPGINGFEVLRTLKQTEMTAHIPVIMLTAKGDSKSKIEGLESEADDYQTKPFNAQELLLRIQNQIQSRQRLQQKLAQQWESSGQPETTFTQNENQFLKKLHKQVETHYKNSELSMSFIASELAMSERQLQRKVKALLGFSPNDFLRNHRLSEAKKLLTTTKQIGHVAQECGFSSQTYFGRCFKEKYGMSPRDYQKQ
ncbi:response regulator [Pleionea sp. CnH1-48]|uniref:response regulator n=1 Tax=Pleionea sp. CnH1-48 TaxID=2954494 RepID=UPI0020984863|nr:response regulator [Pleionea sp. CnH1-48]MCO7225332.1 response regulator [Pleionea sp. CnH1-48]